VLTRLLGLAVGITDAKNSGVTSYESEMSVATALWAVSRLLHLPFHFHLHEAKDAA
jgi:hypothetical protein